MCQNLRRRIPHNWGRSAFADGTMPSGLLLGLLFSLEFIFAGQALPNAHRSSNR
jgi:hypothetical protein